MKLKFDDGVTADEMSALMKAMEIDEGGRFPARAIFHYDLRDPERETIALNHGINVTARDEAGALVGTVRIITDQSYIFYIVDVMVHPSKQGTRVGSGLMELALTEIKKRGFIKVLLTAIPGREDFYLRLGFKPTMSPVLALRGEDYVGNRLPR